MNTTNELIEYYEGGNSIRATAHKFGLTEYIVKKRLKESNVTLRTRQEQLVIENVRRAKPINHNYFSCLNFENVYYLGFLGADGCVRLNSNEIKLCLADIDEDFLIEFKEKLQTECKIGHYTTSNGFNCVSLCFASASIKQDLIKYSIVPNKTYIGTTMKNIPDELKIAFIKGYFDGDGSFSYNKNTKQCMIKITSHTKGILEEFNQFFDGSGRIYQKKDNNYSLEFSTLPSLEIMKQFYNIDTPCLKRKQQKYYDCLELRKQNPRDRNPLQ